MNGTTTVTAQPAITVKEGDTVHWMGYELLVKDIDGSVASLRFPFHGHADFWASASLLTAVPKAAAAQQEHYTAWVTTELSCLPDYCADVTVLLDEVAGYNGDGAPVYQSTGQAQFYAETDADVRGELAGLTMKAEQLLHEAGWNVPGAWVAVETGFVTTVVRQA